MYFFKKTISIYFLDKTRFVYFIKKIYLFIKKKKKLFSIAFIKKIKLDLNFY